MTFVQDTYYGNTVQEWLISLDIVMAITELATGEALTQLQVAILDTK